MKYRCLSDEELKELEGEFKHFLITNNVYTEEWEELNKKKDKKVQEFVEMFSDIVLGKALNFTNKLSMSDYKAKHLDFIKYRPLLNTKKFQNDPVVGYDNPPYNVSGA